jgi:putative component of membrane protein insertase Oxa1/YidC/SpoIIIJ protein YidD
LMIFDWQHKPLDQMSTMLAVELIEKYQQHLSKDIWFIDCRFIETCSEYSKRVLSENGFPKGVWLTFLRLCKCM